MKLRARLLLKADTLGGGLPRPDDVENNRQYLCVFPPHFDEPVAPSDYVRVENTACQSAFVDQGNWRLALRRRPVIRCRRLEPYLNIRVYVQAAQFHHRGPQGVRRPYSRGGVCAGDDQGRYRRTASRNACGRSQHSDTEFPTIHKPLPAAEASFDVRRNVHQAETFPCLPFVRAALQDHARFVLVSAYLVLAGTFTWAIFEDVACGAIIRRATAVLILDHRASPYHGCHLDRLFFRCPLRTSRFLNLGWRTSLSAMTKRAGKVEVESEAQFLVSRRFRRIGRMK
jgi:hypothetical protein